MFKLVLEKAEEPEIKLPTSIRSLKNIYFCFIDYAKAFKVYGSQHTWKILKRWEYQTTWPASWEICMQVKKQQLELDMEQQTGSKSWKEYIKAAYYHPAYLTFMQSTSCKMPGWMKLRCNQVCWEKYQICRWHHSSGRRQRRTKEPLAKSERGE